MEAPARTRLAADPDCESAAAMLQYELEQHTCARCKDQVVRVFNAYAGERLYVRRLDTLRRRQQADAVHWLRLGCSKAEVARRLAQRHEISESTAYRRIAAALDRLR